MSCQTCTKLAPLVKDSGACKSTRSKIGSVRIGCCDLLVESIASSTNTLCAVGYIDDIVALDPLNNPTPLIPVEIFNKEDADENDEFSFDRATEIAEETWSLVLRLKVFNDDHQCTLDSLKGQDVCIFYQIEGKNGNWVWRRFKGKLTGLTGGLIAGYDATFDILNPAEQDKPLFVNFGTADLTTAAIDALTDF